MPVRLLRVSSLSALCLALLLGAVSVAAAPSDSFAWTPQRVASTVGDGAAVSDVDVSFVSRARFKDVTVWVPPRLQGMVYPVPDHFDLLEAGATYTVRLRLSVPYLGREGTYAGAIELRPTRRMRPAVLPVELEVDFGGALVPATTKAFTPAGMRELSLVSPDGSEFLFAFRSPFINDFEVGDILVFGVAPATPGGALRRITAIDATSKSARVSTEPVTLEEAIERGSLRLRQPLRPSDVTSGSSALNGVSLAPAETGGERSGALPEAGASASDVAVPLPAAPTILGFDVRMKEVVLYDGDGDPDTTNDRIVANGSIAFDSWFELAIDIDGFELRSTTFTLNTESKAEINVGSSTELMDFHRKWRVARYVMSPVTVFVGWVPVVVQPVISVNVGADGNVTASVTTGVTAAQTTVAGVRYAHGVFSPISSYTPRFDYTIPTVSLATDLKAYAGPQLALMLYGVAGPYGEVDGYLNLKTDPFARPWLELHGGVEAGAGIRVEILSRVLTDYYEPKLFDYRRLLYSVGEPPATPDAREVRLVLYDFPSNKPGNHSGGGSRTLTLPHGFARVVLTQACFDDVGYIEVNGSRVVDIPPCTGARCYTVNVDVTSLVHAGDNTIYGYANDCVGLSAQAVAVFSVQ